jgi:PAS domain S-box-containing protein
LTENPTTNDLDGALANRLSLALAAAGAGVYEIDRRNRKYWFSSQFVELIGRPLTEEEVFSEGWPIHHPEDAAAIRASISNAYENDLDDVTFESRIVRPDGRSLWIQWHVRAKRDAEGRRIGVVGMVLDIDARKRQEAELTDARRDLQQTSERLKMALRSAGAGVFEADVPSRTFWCSPEFETIVGRRLTFEEGSRPGWSVCHPDDRARVIAAARARRGETEPMAWRMIRPDGEVRWVETHAVTYPNDRGEVDRIVGMIVDIDARKRQEQALIQAEQAASAASEAKAQFLANMSHEIRTPMNGVLGIMNLLHKEPLSSEGRRLLGQAEDCGRLLAQILDDVIDLSKIDAGRMELSPEAVDVAAVLKDVAALLRPQAEGKGVRLATRVNGLDPWVMIDPVRLRQALFNLIGNAIKFTPEGSVEARLFVGEDGDGKRVRFEIEDTGVGIPEAAQRSLFQRFQQADGSTARRFGGSGLGLVITRALTEMMGGDVGFYSEEGRGSTFWLNIPAPAAEAQRGEAEIDLPDLAGMRILVVEDNATNRLVATKILENFGAEIRTAEDGLLGVEAVTAETFDLVLMDVQMPRMDGVEATRAIRGLGAPASRIPIVGLTANVMLHQWKSYGEAGMDGVASKPISPQALLAEIGRVMQQRGRAAAA